jgi:hypothetical protein
VRSHLDRFGKYIISPTREPYLDQLDSDLKDNDTSTYPPSLDDGTSRESSTPNTPKSEHCNTRILMKYCLSRQLGVAYSSTTTYDENPKDLLFDVRPSRQVVEPVTRRQCGINRYNAGEHNHAMIPNQQSMLQGSTIRRFCRFMSSVNSPLRTVDLFTSCNGIG